MKNLIFLILAFCQFSYSNDYTCESKCNCKEDSLIISQLSKANDEIGGKYTEAHKIAAVKVSPPNIINNVYGPGDLSISIKNDDSSKKTQESSSDAFLFITGLISGLGLGIFIFVISTGS